MSDDLVLALESSCDDTAAAIYDAQQGLLASETVTSADLHEAHGGVVPEVASRAHLAKLRILLEKTLHESGRQISDVSVFAATAGPGLLGSLLVGHTAAKTLAVAFGRPFLAINHLEGHLLSPFIGQTHAIPPFIGLIVSGGHTLLVHARSVGQYERLGGTRDDAAGEAFDKVGKMLGLPYPGGPNLEKVAREGDPKAFAFPRSLRGELDFSFSGLKTAVLYTLPKVDLTDPKVMADLTASFQAAVIDSLVTKTMQAAAVSGVKVVAVSGGVSCNGALRKALQEACDREGIQLYLAEPKHCTDNAAMIAWAAWLRIQAGISHSILEDVNPNLPLFQYEGSKPRGRQ